MWAVILLLVVGVAGFSALIVWERKAARTWKVAAEGLLEGVEHRQHSYSRRSGTMVHSTTHYVIRITIIRFQDREELAVNGHFHPEWPKGTRIRVLVNGLDSYRLEKAEP